MELLMIHRTPITITSVNPLHGHEGTIVTLEGTGFSPHIRNNCVVVGGMGACARAEPDSHPTQLKVRIGPVAAPTEGDILAWVGIGADLYIEELTHSAARLAFSETALFRNGTPVASAGVNFKLTAASPNTYAGRVANCSDPRVQLGGQETGSVIRLCLPKAFAPSKHAKVDICVVLKEPTVAIDFAAEISSSDDESCLRAIAKSITVNANLMGEKLFADVARNDQTGDLDLYVTKPYLSNGMVTLRFG